MDKHTEKNNKGTNTRKSARPERTVSPVKKAGSAAGKRKSDFQKKQPGKTRLLLYTEGLLIVFALVVFVCVKMWVKKDNPVSAQETMIVSGAETLDEAENESEQIDVLESDPFFFTLLYGRDQAF